MQTVNEILRLNIKNYVLVDFSMFEKLVNKMGGVTIRMTGAEISAANDNIAGLNKERGVSYLWDGFIFANAGNVRLTGKQALAYARIRKIDSDFKRTSRQFNVLTAIFAKFRAMNLTEQYALLDEMLPLIETDLTGPSIISYAIDVLSTDTSGLLHLTVPIEDHYKSGSVKGSFALLFDMPATALETHAFIYDSTEEPGVAEVLSPGRSLPPRTPSPVTPTPLPETPYNPYPGLGEDEIPIIPEITDSPETPEEVSPVG
jgi:LCP family protein required for cell wall assembly